MQKLKKAFKENYAGYLFIMPVLLGLLLFTLYPMVSSLVYSFSDYDYFNPSKFVGWENYTKIFTTQWPVVGYSVWNTVYYTLLHVPFSLILSYVVALILSNSVKGMRYFRTLFYMPCVIPGIVSALLWRDILDPTYGIANVVLQTLGLPTSQFLSGETSAIPTMFFTSLFSMGGGMVLWLAQFKAIPKDLYECAELEGAGYFKQLFHITIPMSTPIIFYNLVTGVIGSVQIFANAMLLGGGSPSARSPMNFYVTNIYKAAFEDMRMGYASALAWVLFIVVAALTALMFRMSKWVQYGEGA